MRSLDQAGLTEINPAQDTFMQVTIGPGMTKTEAVAYAQSAVIQFRWDGGAWVTVAPGPVACVPDFGAGQVGYYFRYWAH
jgi:hypothetical protein